MKSLYISVRFYYTLDDIFVDALNNPTASLAYDSMCLLSADNLFEATGKALKVVQDIMKMGRNRK